MINYTQCSIIERINDLSDYTETALMHSNYPRAERYALCADIRGAVANLLRLAIRALKKYHKKTTLQDLDIEVEYLRNLVRLSRRKGYISEHRLLTWVNILDSIGRMVGGWIKQQK